MTQMSIAQAMALALQHHQAGRLREAENIYRQIVQVAPSAGDVWGNLGTALMQQGRLPEALPCQKKATELNPASAELWSNLGSTLRALRRHQESEACFRQALAIRRDPQILNHLGALLAELGRMGEAIECYQQALALWPEHAEALHNLGLALRTTGRLGEAEECYRKLVSLRTKDIDARLNLALAVQQQGKFEQVEPIYRDVLAMDATCVVAWTNLGLSLQARGEPGKAEECFKRAIGLGTDKVDAWNAMGLLRQEQGRIEEAIECFKTALNDSPDNAAVHYNLAGILRDQGHWDQSLEGYRHAAKLRPDCLDLQSSVLHDLLYNPKMTVAERLQEHLNWAQRHAAPLYSQIRPHVNDRSPERRLRIGYVSAHMFTNIIANVIDGLLEHHDREQFEIICYNEFQYQSAAGIRVKRHGHTWRDMAAISDEQLTELVREDRIDILVDLAVHTACNHLLTFARKPAPVQVTYLAYNGTTGMTAIDYRFTDWYMHPERSAAADGVEKLVRLPDCYWCYSPYPDAAEVNDLPALKTGQFTFGSVVDYAKVNEGVAQLWSEILRTLPQSRLMIVIAGGERNKHVRPAFEKHGVGPSQIVLEDRRNYHDYWKLYHMVDMALDPFPFNGGVTTLDSLWMGVPVLTLEGDRPLARAGVSILSNLKLPGLIAHSPEEYVKIAGELAGGLPRLAELRRTLRERMRRSPIMDAPRFARNVEAEYRKMWKTWVGAEHF